MPVGQLLAATGKGATKIVADINALTGNGGTKVVEKTVLKELQKSLRGHLLLPNSDGYDDARKGWNGMIDKRPALIVQCHGASDVINAVNLARDYELLTAVRGGGHSAAGKFVCEGGIMIDLSPMQGVHVDPIARSARVEPGVLLGAVDHEAQAFGLATPAGVVSHTGAAGLTVGGGFGKLSRRLGLTCENVRYFDDPDLFWALRGGGGNFGVVTSFEYQLHPVGTEFLAGAVMHPISNVRDALSFYSEYISTAPNEVEVSSTTVMFPNGKGFVSLSAFYGGDPATGEKVLEPLRSFGKPMNDNFAVKKYIDIQRETDRNVPVGQQYYQKTGFLPGIEPAMVDAVEAMTANPKPFAQTCNFTQVGGVISQIDTRATAYANRSAKAQIVLGGSWPKPVDEAEEWIASVRKDWDTMAPLTNGFYINNMMGDEGDKKIRANFGENYDRLVELKNKYDPTNLFRLNANVKPTI
jgi:hypothetical protein